MDADALHHLAPDRKYRVQGRQRILKNHRELIATNLDVYKRQTLERRHRKYFLRFSYTEEAVLTKTSVKDQIICSVDLGINTDAVCTVMQADGTVLGRRFINFPGEKDRLYRTLGRIRRFQRAHGPAQSLSLIHI